MSRFHNSTATLFSDAGNKSYARFKVWKDSRRAPAIFAPIGPNRIAARKAAARLYHNARRFERQTRRRGHQDGAIGRNGLLILHALLFDCLNHVTGQLDPAYETIARLANISVRSVARGLQKLKDKKIISWIRRCRENIGAGGRYELHQESNAYAIAPETQWKDFRSPIAPAPESGTCGEHPPQLAAGEQAAEDLRSGAGMTAVVRMLDRYDANALDRAIARFDRTRRANDDDA